MFNSNKYLVTFLLMHLLTNSVAEPPATDIVEMLSWFGCCVNSKRPWFSIKKITFKMKFCDRNRAIA